MQSWHLGDRLHTTAQQIVMSNSIYQGIEVGVHVHHHHLKEQRNLSMACWVEENPRHLCQVVEGAAGSQVAVQQVVQVADVPRLPPPCHLG